MPYQDCVTIMKLELDHKTKEALDRFMDKNRSVESLEDAVVILLTKALRDVGFLEAEPGKGTRPDMLNSSNDD